MITIKKRSAGKLSITKIKNLSHNTNLAVQRARLLSWLREKPITTIEARKNLDILGVAPRIFELRHNENFNIKTFWSYEIAESGSLHRVAKYILLPGTFKKEVQYG